jgi:hypothetical protein
LSQALNQAGDAQSRVLELEAELRRLSSETGSSSELAKLRRLVTEFETELVTSRTQTQTEIQIASNARQQAEELLVGLRAKFGQLHQEYAQLQEELSEAKAANDLLDDERERLVNYIEKLEDAALSSQEKKDIEVLELDIDIETSQSQEIQIEEDSPRKR